MAEITDEARAILDKKAYASIATLREDGSPQVTIVWIDSDSNEVIFNTAEGRLKTENLKRDPRIAITIPDPENPYKQVLVNGTVTSIDREGADEHIDSLAMKYLGEEKYPYRAEGEVRAIVRVKPEKLTVAG